MERKENPIFNFNAFLISEKISIDKFNQELKTLEKREILCDKLSIGRSEFYQAKQSDIKIDLILRINLFEYENERKIEFEGKLFKIVKTYELDNGLIELTCSEVVF